MNILFFSLYPINVKTAELNGPNIFCFCYNVYKDSMFMVEIKDGRETPRIYISTNPPPPQKLSYVTASPCRYIFL